MKIKNKLRNYLVRSISLLLGTVSSMSYANLNDLTFSENDNNNSAFISSVDISGQGLDDIINKISKVEFEISPKVNAISSAVKASYSIASLTVENSVLSLPIFALYADYDNKVDITIYYDDAGIEKSISKLMSISTPRFIAPNDKTTKLDDFNSTFESISVTQKAASNVTYEDDYFYLKSLSSPVIMDLDGEVRWMLDYSSLSNKNNAMASTFTKGVILLGDAPDIENFRFDSCKSGEQCNFLQTIQLDGTRTEVKLMLHGYSNLVFHHNINVGKADSYLVELHGTNDTSLEKEKSTLLADVKGDATVLKSWNMRDIIKKHIKKNNGDDTDFFSDADWSHMNSAIYSASDDTVIVSLRNTFVMKFDYQTGDVIWVLGDAGRKWANSQYKLDSYNLVSLNGEYPIGHHSLSLDSNGDLLLFNNSTNPDTKAPVNGTSLVETYSLAEEGMMKTEVISSYDAGFYSSICSSVIQSGNNYVINYATATNNTENVIQVINHSGTKLFEAIIDNSQYSRGNWCGHSWNIEPIKMNDIVY